MQTKFTLELYFEDDRDRGFAEHERFELTQLVSTLAPHVELEVVLLIGEAPQALPVGQLQIPVQFPSSGSRQSLLISCQDLCLDGRRLDGYGWRSPSRTGYLNRQRMEEKRQAGGNSADITIHEWLHTIEGLEINGSKVPFPDHHERFTDRNGLRFKEDSEKGRDRCPTWYRWYAHALDPIRLKLQNPILPQMPQGVIGPRGPESGTLH
jgi:hypothetical protein